MGLLLTLMNVRLTMDLHVDWNVMQDILSRDPLKGFVTRLIKFKIPKKLNGAGHRPIVKVA